MSNNIIDLFNGLEENNLNTENLIPTGFFKSFVMRFVMNQMLDIQTQDNLRSKIESELLNRLPDLTANELTNFYKAVMNQKNLNIVSVLEPFKGTTTQASPLLPSADSNDADEINEFQNSMNPEQIKAMQKMFLLFEKLGKEGNFKE